MIVVILSIKHFLLEKQNIFLSFLLSFKPKNFNSTIFRSLSFQGKVCWIRHKWANIVLKWFSVSEFCISEKLHKQVWQINNKKIKCDEFKPLSSHNNQTPENLIWSMHNHFYSDEPARITRMFILWSSNFGWLNDLSRTTMSNCAASN